MTTRIVETPALGEWSEEWDALALMSTLPTPFLRTWWMSGVATPEDHFVLLVDGDTLVGGIALRRRRVLGVNWFGVLGGGKLCPDHLDLVALPDRVGEVGEELARWFTARGSRVLDLDGLRADSSIAAAIQPSRLSAVDVAPFEPLTTSPDDYYAARSASFVKRVRKFRRRSEKDGVRYRRVDPREASGAMAAFVTMHEAREDRAELARELSRVVRAVERGVADDEARIYVAEKDGRYGVVLLLFTTGGRLCVYQTARAVDDAEFNHAGTVIDAVAIEDAAVEGLTEVDFLRGAEPFKSSFTAHVRPLLRLRASHGLGGWLLLRTIELAESIRRRLGAARRAISRVGSSPEK